MRLSAHQTEDGPLGPPDGPEKRTEPPVACSRCWVTRPHEWDGCLQVSCPMKQWRETHVRKENR